MERRGQTVVEKLRGVGTVYAGDEVVCSAKHHIEVFQKWIETPPDFERLNLMQGMNARLDPIDKSMFELFNAQDLRLEIEDGRRMYFFLQNTNTGRIMNQGGRGLHFP